MEQDIYLNVRIADKLVGNLFPPSEESNFLYFRYDPQWIQNGFAISPHIPLGATRVAGVTITRFLENLFPEGEALELVLERFRLSKSNTFGIIKLLGGETTGALQFFINNAEPTKTSFRFLPVSELANRLDHRANQNLIIWDDKPRLSVTGIQDKLPVTILSNGKMGFGEGEMASTQIIKFQRLHNEAPHLVLNEFFCMKLASNIGLPVADIQYHLIGNHPALIVKRFDRQLINDNVVERKHIIDGCQALNLAPSYKYEQQFGSSRDVEHIRDGVSMPKLIKFCQHAKVPAVAILKLLNWQIFNLIISNMDAHGKNISFYMDKSGIEVAPYYDLVNISMYPTFEQSFAMAIGDEFNPKNIHAYQLAQFAADCNIHFELLTKQIMLLTTKTLSVLDELPLNLVALSKNEITFIKQLKQNITTSAKRLISEAKNIKQFQSEF